MVCQCVHFVVRVGVFEATELGGPNAGRVKAVLHPLSAQWENAYSQPSDGSMVVATQDPSQEDIWAGATGLYISQVMPDGSRRARFGGYIPKFNGAGGGATTVAFHSVDKFWEKRLLMGPNDPYRLDVLYQPDVTILQVFKPNSPTGLTTVYGPDDHDGGQATLAAFLANLARGNLEGEGFTGIPTLTAVADAPNDIFPTAAASIYNWWDFKNIGQAIRELVEAEDGVKYWLEHEYTDGYWSTVAHFSDVIGTDRDYTILSDREAWQYGLEVDASEKATRVIGIGSGEEGYTQFSIAYDADGIDNLPEHQATVAWKDQTDPTIINSLTRGYVTDHRDPTTVPSVTLVGLPDYDPDAPDYDPQKGFPGPEILEPGDTFDVDIGYGVITVKDIRVRALAIAWNLEQGMTAQRTLAMQPIIRANTSVRTQTAAKPPAPTQPVEAVAPTVPTSNPWPTPGLVSRVSGGLLTEISGMQASFKNLGHVWVFNDEKQNPQVRLVKTSTGVPVGSYNVTGVSPAPWGDPEAIRLARSIGKLVLADIGDNSNNRPTSGANQPSLLVVAEPKGAGAKGTLPTTRLPISYPNGLQVNAETLLIHPATSQVYIITKEPTQARVYSFGTLASMNTTDNEGVLVATLGVSMVSDGTHTWAGDFVLLRTAKVAHTVVYDWSPVWKKVGDIATPAMTKSEAITAESTCAFLTTTETKGTGDESNGAPIYRVLVPKAYGALCNTVAGPVDSGTGGEGPNGPKVVPGQVFNMQPWKLELPFSEGDSVKQITWSKLATFEQKPYFWTEGAATGVVFQVPVGGATTPNSSNPRTELRQMNNNGTKAAWSNKTQTWTIEGVMAFNAIPTSSDATRGTVGMQLHDDLDDVTVLRLEKNGDLWITRGDTAHVHLVTGSYVFGTFMKVKLEARKGGGVRWYINDQFEFLARSGVVEGCYFKAGAYAQIGPGATGVGRVTYKKLKVWRS